MSAFAIRGSGRGRGLSDFWVDTAMMPTNFPFLFGRRRSGIRDCPARQDVTLQAKRVHNVMVSQSCKHQDPRLRLSDKVTKT